MTATHDANNRVVAVTDGAGRQLTFQYTGDRLESVTAPNGVITRFAYDVGARPSEVTDPGGYKVRYVYDNSDRIVEAYDGNNHLDVRNAYDTNQRVISQKDALDNESTFTYDVAGKTTTKRDPRGGQRVYTYDAAGRVLTYRPCPTAARPSGSTTATAMWSRPGYPRGNSTNRAYDARGNVTEEVDAIGGSASMSYTEDLLTALDRRRWRDHGVHVRQRTQPAHRDRRHRSDDHPHLQQPRAQAYNEQPGRADAQLHVQRPGRPHVNHRRTRERNHHGLRRAESAHRANGC